MGLNAGGKNKAASAYYLPLEQVVRALKLIQVRVSGAQRSRWCWSEADTGEGLSAAQRSRCRPNPPSTHVCLRPGEIVQKLPVLTSLTGSEDVSTSVWLEQTR